MKINPVMQVHQPDRSADRFYNLGRYHQRRTEYQDAIVAYQQALKADPVYVEAHNGLGITYAMQGQYKLSLEHFRQAIAMLPAATYLYNNLAYVFQLQKRYDEAVIVYQEALRLDPLNHKARKNLANLNHQLERDTAAASVEMKTTPDIPDKATPVSVATLEKTGQALKIVQIAPHVYELKNTASTTKKISEKALQKADAAPVALADHKADHATARKYNAPHKRRIEVSNGNGVSGMAKKVANFLEQAGYSDARLTNYDHYQQATTEIHYRPGHHNRALQIRSLLPDGTIKAVENSHLRDDVAIRVLLGKDLLLAVDHFNNGTVLLDRLALNHP